MKVTTLKTVPKHSMGTRQQFSRSTSPKYGQPLKIHFLEKNHTIITQRKTMYAVTFDIDTNCLGDQYQNDSPTNAYGDIRKFMEANQFAWQQGSVYFGNGTGAYFLHSYNIQQF